VFEYVMGDIAEVACSKWRTAVDSWSQQLAYMNDRQQTEERQAAAIVHARQFVKQYHAAAGPASITYYLHGLHDHPEWFYCYTADAKFQSAVSWWSAQAMEASHRIRKRVLRSHTRHGKEILRWVVDSEGVAVQKVTRHATNIYELFRWQYRMLIYKRLQLDEDAARAVKVVTCAQLNCLSQQGKGDDYQWSEAEVLAVYHCKAPTKLRVVGPGKITSKLFVSASEGTYFAVDAFEFPHRGKLSVGRKSGRKPQSQMDEREKGVIAQRHLSRKQAQECRAILQAGYPDADGGYRMLYEKATM
jgi:hypothetical protein